MVHVARSGCHHWLYGVSCEEADALIANAGGKCQRCGACRPLVYDHDHALGLKAVRGLICRPCNRRLGEVDAGRTARDEVDDRYLRAAWHLDHRSASDVTPRGRRPMQLVSCRTPLKLWEEAKAKADERQENISDVIREALERYIKKR